MCWHEEEEIRISEGVVGAVATLHTGEEASHTEEVNNFGEEAMCMPHFPSNINKSSQRSHNLVHTPNMKYRVAKNYKTPRTMKGPIWEPSVLRRETKYD